MTSDRDFDRLARAWLDLGPDEAPDRVIAAVLQAADATPQVRGRIRRPTWRFPQMNRLPMLATAVVAIAVLVGGGLFLTRSNEPATGLNPATEAPTVSPIASASPSAEVPAALQYDWVGPKRVIAGMPQYHRYRFTLGTGTLWFPNDDLNSSVLASSASAVGPNQLRLVATDGRPSAICTTGAIGTYSWSLSPGGVRLRMTAVNDECPTRALALTGDWTRVACTLVSSGCNGVLEAGTFSTQYVAPKVEPGETWNPDFGAVTYTVPEGWANSSDWPSTFSLTPTEDYALETVNGPPPDVFHGIWIFANPAASVQNAECTNQEQKQIGHSVSALIAWVRSRPSLVTTAPTPITIGGLSGQWLDVKIAPDWHATCPLPGGSQSPPIALYLSESGNDADGWSINVQGAEQQRLILLDLGGGKTVSIFVDSTYPDRFADLVAKAMPIVESFRFK